MIAKMSKILCTLALAVCMFTLSACGKDGGGSKTGKVTGTYELTAARADGTNEGAEQFEMMKEMGMSATLTLNEDGKGQLNMFGTLIEITYDTEKKTITVYDQAMEYTFEDPVFTFTWEGTALDFTKTDAS